MDGFYGQLFFQASEIHFLEKTNDKDTVLNIYCRTGEQGGKDQEHPRTEPCNE